MSKRCGTKTETESQDSRANEHAYGKFRKVEVSVETEQIIDAIASKVPASGDSCY